jgi:hypothetical protein
MHVFLSEITFSPPVLEVFSFYGFIQSWFAVLPIVFNLWEANWVLGRMPVLHSAKQELHNSVSWEENSAQQVVATVNLGKTKEHTSSQAAKKKA